MPQKDKKQKKIEEFTNKTRGPAMAGKAGGSQQTDATTPSDGNVALSAETQAVLTAMKELKCDISQQIGTVMEKLGLMQAHMDSLTERQRDLGTRVDSIELGVPVIQASTVEHDAEISKLRAALEDLEGRSRRSNVRMLGMPENLKITTMETTMEELIRTLLPKAQLSAQFVVERAHRSLARKPPPGAPPRAIIMKLLNYRDRDEILKAAREQPIINHEGHKISFYPDLSLAVQQARRKYDTVKEELRKRAIPYAMFHPAKLRVTYDNKTHFFLDPGTAWDFVEKSVKRCNTGGEQDGDTEETA